MDFKTDPEGNIIIPRWDASGYWVSGICWHCRHKVSGSYPAVCAAFPGGIPEDIRTGLADHRNLYPGDRGIRYASTGKVVEERRDADGSLWTRERPS